MGPILIKVKENDLNAQLRSLKELQDIDIVWSDVNKEINNINAKIDGKARELEETRQRIEILSNSIKEKDLRKKIVEGEIRTDDEVVKRWEGRLKEIKSSREYQALMREISLTKKDISEKEDIVLQLIEEIEKGDAELKTLQEDYDNSFKIWNSENTGLIEKIEELRNKIKNNDSKRSEILKTLSGSLIQKYERIRIQRDGIAIAEAKNYVCCGCNMNIPPQIYNQVLKRENIISCPHCQRILYVPEEEKMNA
ncbi:MAG TPA: C4-type zinc ribbon domain-containing protein [bacterium]